MSNPPAAVDAPGAALTGTSLGPWENSADCAYLRDPHGRILAVNLSFARKFGRAAGSFIDHNVTEFVHADDAALISAAAAEVVQPPHQTVGEHRWMTPQGVRWVEWDETGVVDPSGRLTVIRAVGRDITRRRLAEEQFYRLSRAVEQSPVSIVITDLDGHAQYVNSKFTEVTGHTLEDIIDQDIQVLREGHADPSSFNEFWRTVRSGGEWRGELSTHRRDGSVIWESVKVSCVRNADGEITNILCLREDITDRKVLEHQLRQAQKMESLGTLAGGIAHDFNNLLAIINGYSEFCQQGTPDAALLTKSLREIHNAAVRASGLVRQILTFSRKTDVKFAPVDLNQLIRDLTTLMAETFPRTVTVRLELPEKLPALLADHNQLQQIILNLCVNARDAMPSGGTITISTRAVSGSALRRLGGDAAKHYACLQVVDTGTGMSPEVRQRIFEPFFTTKQGNHGTGLGLAVVYGIVVSHHGFIDVESTPGQGSAFSVYLPLAETGPAIASGTGISEFPSGTESLLIVDDEQSLRTLLTTALTRKGYKITTAESGIEAIELISDTTRHFDAVLLDLNMPGASGLEVMKVIRLCRPRLGVVIVSGHITPTARTEFEKLGQRNFVQKPYKLDELGRQIRRLLDAPSVPGA